MNNEVENKVNRREIYFAKVSNFGSPGISSTEYYIGSDGYVYAYEYDSSWRVHTVPFRIGWKYKESCQMNKVEMKVRIGEEIPY